MNASERARNYRRRVREYIEDLEANDEALMRDVQHLEILQTIQHRLVEANITTTRSHILAYVWQFLDEQAYLKPLILMTPRFQVQSVRVYGTDNGVILHIHAVVSGVFSSATVEQQLYPFIPGNAGLLDKLLRTTLSFPTSLRFYFDENGDFVQHTGETDFVVALMDSLACSAVELRQLLVALGEPTAIHSTSEAPTRPTVTRSLLGREKQHRTNLENN